MTSEELYQRNCAEPSDIALHLPLLRALADDCDTVVEFGVRTGRSTSAFLASTCKRVVSYDVAVPQFRPPLDVVAKFTLLRQDTANLVQPIPACDLLFLDTTHTAAQVRAEFRHAPQVRKYIVLHDTYTFGLRDEYGAAAPGAGILQPLLEFLAANPDWRVHSHTPHCNGLTVLQRISEATL